MLKNSVEERCHKKLVIKSHRFHGIKDYLLVQCPVSLNASKTALKTFTIEINEEDVGLNQSQKIEYDVEKLVEVERVDDKVSSQLKRMKEIKVGITTTFSGVREKLLEWITYHSIIGFDHIWIYINEPWLNGTGLPLEMPGVTFIPYDNKIQNHWKDFKREGKVRTDTKDTWRANTQVDALWRAKRMDMDWMAFVDLDEFVVCLNHASVIPNVKEFLKPFQETYGQQFSGVFLKSIPFGRNMELPHPGNMMLNYTWR